MQWAAVLGALWGLVPGAGVLAEFPDLSGKGGLELPPRRTFKGEMRPILTFPGGPVIPVVTPVEWTGCLWTLNTQASLHWRPFCSVEMFCL